MTAISLLRPGGDRRGITGDTGDTGDTGTGTGTGTGHDIGGGPLDPFGVPFHSTPVCSTADSP
jgi:hypothetical protein